MTIRRIRHKLLIVLALALSLGFLALAFFYNQAVERSIMSEYQRTLHRLTDSVIMSIETIMSETHAEIMPEYAKRLKALPGLIDFRIARIDGTEAFLDNRTIRKVNEQLGEARFQPRNKLENPLQVFDPVDPFIGQVLAGQEAVFRTLATDKNGNIVELFDPIRNRQICHTCHSSAESLRGVLKVTASLADVERDMMNARLQSLVVLAFSLLVTMSITGYMLGRSVAAPIESVTEAMAKIAAGDYSSQVAVERQDEVGNMARSFNKMALELRDNYLTMLREQEKLSMVIQGGARGDCGHRCRG